MTKTGYDEHEHWWQSATW